MVFKFNNQEYMGDSFEYKNDILYIDGYAIENFKTKDTINIEGNGNFITDKNVVIYGDYNGDIIAKKVIINGEHKGKIKTNKIIDNR